MDTLLPLVLPLFGLWAFGLFLLLFRSGPGWVWKISSILIFVFYALWFRDSIFASQELYRGAFNTTVPVFFGLLKELMAVGLFFLWPLMVYVAFQVGAPEQSAGLVRTMVLLTLFFWLFWLLNFFLAPWPEETLRQLLPEKFTLPQLPQPPTRAQ